VVLSYGVVEGARRREGGVHASVQEGGHLST
jgi:hypothetical protein